VAKLIWDQTTKRRYEAGVERGVLYPSEGPGVVWNGLLSVDESFDGGELSSYAENGITYLNSVSSKNYRATIKAFSAPREFSPCIGDLEVMPGFTLTRQPRAHFSLSYRTRISDLGYKIHIVYDAVANPTARSYASTNDTPTPVNLEWDINASPVNTGAYRPTPHFIVDSTKASWYALANLEDRLYGTSETDPTLPTPDEVLDILINTDSIDDFIFETI
jgi:hypothetical protein